VVEPEDLEGPPSAYVRKETLVRKDDDDGIDTSASDADDEDDEMNDGSSVNVPPL